MRPEQQLKQYATKYQLKRFVNFEIPSACIISRTLIRMVVSLNMYDNSVSNCVC